MDQRNICSYADIVDKSVDLRVLELKAIFLKLCSLFRFRDDILISAWERNSRKAKYLFYYPQFFRSKLTTYKGRRRKSLSFCYQG